MMPIDITKYVPITQAYIDPGTGSMLFTILIGLISAGVYAIRGLLIKLRFHSKTDKKNKNHYDIAIYTDSKRYWNIFKPICDEFEKRKEQIAYLTQSSDDPCFKEKYNYVKCEFIGEGNKGIAKMNILDADIVLTSTPSLDVYQWKRSKNVKYYIHIPHAVNDPVMYRMFGLDFFDSVIMTGDYQIKQLREIEQLHNVKEKELITAGLIYFDEMKSRLDDSVKTKNDVPVVLLAPSWGPSSILNRFGDTIIEKLVETGYKIVVRPHPQSYISDKKMIDNIISKHPEIEWNKDNDNFDILKKADILISDFSGIIFDFALVFDKPIIYTDTKYDKSIYDAWWLKEELWTFDTLPRIGKELNDSNIDKIKELIDNCLCDSELAKGRQQARDESWECRGTSVIKTIEYLLNKKEELTNE